MAERGLDTAQVQEYPRFYAARVPHVPFQQGSELFHGPAYFLPRLASLLPWGFVTCVGSLDFAVELLFPPSWCSARSPGCVSGLGDVLQQTGTSPSSPASM